MAYESQVWMEAKATLWFELTDQIHNHCIPMLLCTRITFSDDVRSPQCGLKNTNPTKASNVLVKTKKIPELLYLSFSKQTKYEKWKEKATDILRPGKNTGTKK